MMMTPSALYEYCVICPRRCGVNRSAGARGFCGETDSLRLAAACLHTGEEPPLVGKNGSGALFVSGCNLRCVFCQNRLVSQEGAGREVSAAEFSALCLRLQKLGAANINIVTGAHAAPALIAALAQARADGLVLPVVWNSSGYESRAQIDRLCAAVNVFLPDLKTLDSATADVFFNAADYPEAAARAILRMIEQKPLEFTAEGALVSGVIVRHLALPGRLAQTRRVLEWFARHAAGRALLSLMTQYTPVPAMASAAPRRRVNTEEAAELLHYLEDAGIEDGYYQEWEEDGAKLPDFAQPQPFPPSLARCVWHWKSGWIA